MWEPEGERQKGTEKYANTWLLKLLLFDEKINLLIQGTWWTQEMIN